MNDKDIEEFVRAFADFMKHSEVEELYYEGRQASKQYARLFYEKKAKEMGVSVEYYIQEFV
jgi:hypothetical protein